MMHDTLKAMVKRISKPSWHPCLQNVANYHDCVGKLNIFWVLVGRPTSMPEQVFEVHKAHWFLAWHLGEARIDNSPLFEYACLLTQDQFYDLLCANPLVAERFMPMKSWKKLFTKAGYPNGYRRFN